MTEHKNISIEVLSRRFFSFWYETDARRKPLENSLLDCLKEILPSKVIKGISKQIDSLKQTSARLLESRVTLLRRASNDRAQARSEFARIQADFPERRKRLKLLRDVVRQSIQSHKNATREFIEDKIRPCLLHPELRKLIESFPDKKHAKESILTRATETAQAQMNKFLKERAESLMKDIEKYLSEFEMPLFGDTPSPNEQVNFPFDAKGMFAASVAGLSTAGALSLVASTMGNLGGYILVAKGVSLLSTMGISVGGTAAAVEAVAIIGGPVTLAIGLAALAAVGTWTLFGESWQNRLAKKAEKALLNFIEAFSKRCDDFWLTTESNFNNVADEIERKYDGYVENLSEQIETGSSLEMENTLAETLRLRDFFAGIPWEVPVEGVDLHGK
jgi:ElaB/YqjD/DUF883 family membrane-anchored ribosome-binding protein